MKIAAFAFILVNIASIIILALAPYGHKLLEIYALYPLTVFCLIFIANWNKPKQLHRQPLLIPCIITWACVLFLSNQLLNRNERFTLSIDGVVQSVYRGDHHSPAINITQQDQTIISLSYLNEAQWKMISEGERFTKKNGTFEALCANRQIILNQNSALDRWRRPSIPE